MCFINLKKAFERVSRKILEWAMRKRGIPEVMVRAVMSLYEGAKTRVRVRLPAPGIHVVVIGFAIVVDVVSGNVRNGLMSEMLYADDLVLMSEVMERLSEVLEMEGSI